MESVPVLLTWVTLADVAARALVQLREGCFLEDSSRTPPGSTEARSTTRGIQRRCNVPKLQRRCAVRNWAIQCGHNYHLLHWILRCTPLRTSRGRQTAFQRLNCEKLTLSSFPALGISHNLLCYLRHHASEPKNDLSPESSVHGWLHNQHSRHSYWYVLFCPCII